MLAHPRNSLYVVGKIDSELSKAIEAVCEIYYIEIAHTNGILDRLLTEYETHVRKNSIFDAPITVRLFNHISHKDPRLKKKESIIRYVIKNPARAFRLCQDKVQLLQYALYIWGSQKDTISGLIDPDLHRLLVEMIGEEKYGLDVVTDIAYVCMNTFPSDIGFADTITYRILRTRCNYRIDDEEVIGILACFQGMNMAITRKTSIRLEVECLDTEDRKTMVWLCMRFLSCCQLNPDILLAEPRLHILEAFAMELFGDAICDYEATITDMLFEQRLFVETIVKVIKRIYLLDDENKISPSRLQGVTAIVSNLWQNKPTALTLLDPECQFINAFLDNFNLLRPGFGNITATKMLTTILLADTERRYNRQIVQHVLPFVREEFFLETSLSEALDEMKSRFRMVWQLLNAVCIYSSEATRALFGPSSTADAWIKCISEHLVRESPSITLLIESIEALANLSGRMFFDEQAIVEKVMNDVVQALNFPNVLHEEWEMPDTDRKYRMLCAALQFTANVCKFERSRQALASCAIARLITEGFDFLLQQYKMKEGEKVEDEKQLHLIRMLMSCMIRLTYQSPIGKKEVHDHEILSKNMLEFLLRYVHNQTAMDLAFWAIFNCCAGSRPNRDTMSQYPHAKSLVDAFNRWKSDEYVATRACKLIHLLCRSRENRKHFVTRLKAVEVVRVCAADDKFKTAALSVLK